MMNAILQTARRVLHEEGSALVRLGEKLDQSFLAAHALIIAGTGRVVVSGIGKSGHIGHKIASTLASTGTPAFFLHPAEALHGDLGMIQPEDVVIALSYSGETEELRAVVPLLKRRGSKIIALTGHPESSLARLADVHLDVSVEREACPHNLAPTTSSTATLALGDALAISLLESRGFSAEDFASTHPGGTLGKRLLTRVADIMHTGPELPYVHPDADLSETLKAMSAGGLGITYVLSEDQRLLGVFTDGDLRRALENGLSDPKSVKIAALMTQNATTILPERTALEAADIMQKRRINALAVVNEDGALIGAFNMHDLMRAGIV